MVVGPAVRLAVRDTRAGELRTPVGTLLLVQAGTAVPAAVTGVAFAGVGLRTTSTELIRERVHTTHGLDLRPYFGLDGRSVLVRAKWARGASIEFFDRSRTDRKG